MFSLPLDSTFSFLGFEECSFFLKAGENFCSQGAFHEARAIFEAVIIVDPGNERATFNLIALLEDEDIECKKFLLESMLVNHPDNSRGLSILKEIESRRSMLEEIEDMVSTSPYLLSWREREKIQGDLLLNIDGRPNPIRKLGELLIGQGYCTFEQIETGLQLQHLLKKLGYHQQLGQILVDYRYLSVAQLEECLKAQEIDFQAALY
jgi:hypothetical protein